MRKFAVAILLVVLNAPAGHALSDQPYLTASQFDGMALLPPPPAPDSALQKQDLAAVLAVQRARTPVLIQRAQADRDFLGFATVLGPKFTADNIPNAAAFIRKVTRETGAMVDRVKDCWQRPRPFVVSKDVEPADNAGLNMMTKPGAVVRNDAPHGAGSPCKQAETPVASYSYPSGGANAGMTAGILLAMMVPEKRAEIFARAWEYGENRVILGVHYPSDIEAGRLNATAMIAVMLQSPAFAADLAQAKAEVRQVLALP
jgi:acid phosphatase (class A)